MASKVLDIPTLCLHPAPPLQPNLPTPFPPKFPTFLLPSNTFSRYCPPARIRAVYNRLIHQVHPLVEGFWSILYRGKCRYKSRLYVFWLLHVGIVTFAIRTVQGRFRQYLRRLKWWVRDGLTLWSLGKDLLFLLVVIPYLVYWPISVFTKILVLSSSCLQVFFGVLNIHCTFIQSLTTI